MNDSLQSRPDTLSTCCGRRCVSCGQNNLLVGHCCLSSAFVFFVVSWTASSDLLCVNSGAVSKLCMFGICTPYFQGAQQQRYGVGSWFLLAATRRAFISTALLRSYFCSHFLFTSRLRLMPPVDRRGTRSRSRAPAVAPPNADIQAALARGARANPPRRIFLSCARTCHL